MKPKDESMRQHAKQIWKNLQILRQRLDFACDAYDELYSCLYMFKPSPVEQSPFPVEETVKELMETRDEWIIF